MRADGKAFVLLDGASGVLALPVAAELPARLLVGRRVVVAGDDAATWLVVGLTGGSVLNVPDGLLQLDAAGDVPDAQLAANVARTNAAQTWTATQTYTAMHTLNGTTSFNGVANFNADAGFGSPILGNSRLTGVYLPRYPDLNHVVWLDEQDEFALLTREPNRTATITPAPSGGIACVFYDDAQTVSYAAGSSPYPMVIELDALSNPILGNASARYMLALTFRSTPATVVPASIRIETWNTSTSAYVEVVNTALTVLNGVVKTPSWLAPNVNVYKLRVTLDGTNPLGAGDTLRLQRVMLYHATATRDPWHLHRLGGTVWGSVGIFGALATAYGTVTANTTLNETHSVVGVDATGGARTITLPSAATCGGRLYTVKRLNGGANAVTLATTGGQTIDGAASYVLGAQWQSVRVVSDGSNWLLV